MKLIIGLGNYGLKYQHTRHNAGFLCLDYYLYSNNKQLNNEKFQGLYLKDKVNGKDVIFLEPLTYMNLSGNAVKKFMDYFKIDHKDILVLYDELDLPLGQYRLRNKGSANGHNGLQNIIGQLKTDQFLRVKIGISRPNPLISIPDYVLSKFKQEELNNLKPCFEKINKIIDDFVAGVDINKILSKNY